MKIHTLITGILILITSCRDKEKNETIEIQSQKNEEVKLEDYIVYENPFLKMDSDADIFYNNVKLQKDGMLFDGQDKSPSFIKVPFTILDLSKPFNISFSYNTSSDDGSKPQTFIALVDDYSSPGRNIPLFIYTAGKRITGVYGDQALWAENYFRSEGESKSYYDSYQLKSNEFYFVSINFTGNTIEIYVNSELYSSFDNIKPHELKYKTMLIGALPEGDTFVTQFSGVIHGLKIFNKALSEKEIVSVYNLQPYVEIVN